MTLFKAIEGANALRPNSIDNALKAQWIYEVEAEVAELMELPIRPNPYPSDAKLLMPSPYDNIYHLYVCAMIDNTIEDTALFINDRAIANEAKDTAFRWWRRHVRKGCPQYIRAFPWQRPVGGSHGMVTSVNGMTGDVELEAKNIPFDNSMAENVSNELQGAVTEAIRKPAAMITTPENYEEHKEYYDSLNTIVFVDEEEE